MQIVSSGALQHIHHLLIMAIYLIGLFLDSPALLHCLGVSTFYVPFDQYLQCAAFRACQIRQVTFVTVTSEKMSTARLHALAFRSPPKSFKSA